MAEIRSHVKPGDWVRFQHDQRLVVGVVQYIREANYPYEWEAVTDCGTVPDRRILEVRPPAERPHDTTETNDG